MGLQIDKSLMLFFPALLHLLSHLGLCFSSSFSLLATRSRLPHFILLLFFLNSLSHHPASSLPDLWLPAPLPSIRSQFLSKIYSYSGFLCQRANTLLTHLYLTSDFWLRSGSSIYLASSYRIDTGSCVCLREPCCVLNHSAPRRSQRQLFHQKYLKGSPLCLIVSLLYYHSALPPV